MSIWDASIETANRWYDISWYGLLISGCIAAFAAAGTVAFLFLQFWSSAIRERHSDFRTTSLEAQAQRANADLAIAKADIANANARTAEAELEQEKLRADNLAIQATVRPRRLSFIGWTQNPERVAAIYNGLKKYSGTLASEATASPAYPAAERGCRAMWHLGG